MEESEGLILYRRQPETYLHAVLLLCRRHNIINIENLIHLAMEIKGKTVHYSCMLFQPLLVVISPHLSDHGIPLTIGMVHGLWANSI